MGRAGFTFDFLSLAYLSRLAFSVMCLFCAAYLNSLASVVAGYRTPWIDRKDLDGKSTGQGTLPDIGHDLCSALVTAMGFDNAEVDLWLEINGFLIPDTVVSIMASTTLIFVLAHPKRFQILRRTLIIQAFVFLLRSICVFSTQLPDAHPICQAQFTSPSGAYKRKPMFPKAFARAWVVLWAHDEHITCGDMVFSGHTTVLSLCAMVFFQYCRVDEMRTAGPVFTQPLAYLTGGRLRVTERTCGFARALTAVYALVGACLIIATRLHYTLDVALALYLTSRSFRWYHDAASYEKLKRRKSIFLCMRGSMMRWLEAEEVIKVEASAFQNAQAGSSEKKRAD